MGPLASFLGMALVSYLSGKQTITNQGLGLVFSPCEGQRLSVCLFAPHLAL